MTSPEKPQIGEKIALCMIGGCPTAQFQPDGSCVLEEDGRQITLPPEAQAKLAQLIQETIRGLGRVV